MIVSRGASLVFKFLVNLPLEDAPGVDPHGDVLEDVPCKSAPSVTATKGSTSVHLEDVSDNSFNEGILKMSLR